MPTIKELYPETTIGALDRVRNFAIATYQAANVTYEIHVGIDGVHHQKNKDGTTGQLPTGLLEVDLGREDNPNLSLKYLEMGVQFDAEGNLIGLDNRDITVWHHADNGDVYRVNYKIEEPKTEQSDPSIAKVHSIQKLDTKTNITRELVELASGLSEIGYPPYLYSQINWVKTFGQYMTGKTNMDDQAPLIGDIIMWTPLVGAPLH
jgi:hypothetical protein